MTSMIREAVVRRWAPAAMAAVLATACAGAAEVGGAATSPSPAARASLDAQMPAPQTPAPGATATPSGDAGPTAEPTTTDEGAAMTIDPALDRIVELAVADLSSRLGVDPDQITVVLAEAVTWPDGALGCPQPNMRYVQVPKDGARIHLEVDDRLYRYHTGGRRTEPFLCEPGIDKQPRTTRTLQPRLPERPER